MTILANTLMNTSNESSSRLKEESGILHALNLKANAERRTAGRAGLVQRLAVATPVLRRTSSDDSTHA